MVFSYDWIQSFFKSKLPSPQKMAEDFVMHSFEVDEIEKRGSDWILDIDVLPNRGPDCFSHYGIAREYAAISGRKISKKEAKLSETGKKAGSLVSISIEDKNDCPRYSARIIEGVKVGPSPKWLQQRLEACGLRPINNIVDATNYAMLETGQPLHAFDFDKLKGKGKKEITVRRAKQGEKILALDDEEYVLNKNVLVIAGPEEILAVAGIKGGKSSEIDGRTKTIVIEAANFNPTVINKGSKEIGLKTDASVRFEHGLDLKMAEIGLDNAASLIADTAGGEVLSGRAELFLQKAFPKTIRLDLSYLKSLLGVEIKSKEAEKILSNLGFKTSFSKGALTVAVPSFRLDVSLPEDVIEEIGRVHGYEKIAPVFPETAMIPPQKNEDAIWEDVCKDLLKSLGFFEVYNYSFISEKDLKNFRFNSGVLELKNPLSQEFKYMRPSLIPRLLDNVRENSKYFGEINIFELGKIYSKGKVSEKRCLAAMLFQKSGKDEQFYKAKGVVDWLLGGMGISEVWYRECRSFGRLFCHPKKCADIMVSNEAVGFLGEISSSLQEAKGVSGKTVAFEMDFEKLQNISTQEAVYQPVSKYPAATRDLAVLVPFGTKVESVLNRINAVGGPLIRDIDLFDIYEGKELPEGKKSLAFRVIYQASDRTLSSEEIDSLQENIIRDLEKDPEWQVRK